MANKTEFIYYRESALQSIVADTFMFGGILGLMYFNHRVLNGNAFIDLIFIFFMLVSAIGRTNSRQHRFTSWEELKKFIDKETK